MVESKHARSDIDVSRLLIYCYGKGFPDKLVLYVYEFDISAIDFDGMDRCIASTETMRNSFAARRSSIPATPL